MKKHGSSPGLSGSHNPFGAMAPREVLCIESRPLVTQRDGTVWIFLAMDEFSHYAIHHTIQRTNILPDYVSFLFEVLRKDPEVKSATLAIDGRPDLAGALHKVFPHFAKVICENAGVYEVTEEFHVAFLASMGMAGRGN